MTLVKPLKYQSDLPPLDEVVDDRFDIGPYDVTLVSVREGILRLYSGIETFRTAYYKTPEGSFEEYVDDRIYDPFGPMSLAVNILKERGIFFSIKDEDLQRDLNLEDFSDLSQNNKRSIAKALPNPFVAWEGLVYDLDTYVRVNHKFSNYPLLLVLSLLSQDKLRFFLEYQLNQFPNGSYFSLHPFKSEEKEIVEVEDHASFLDELNTCLVMMKSRFTWAGYEALHEEAKRWVEEKQREVERSTIGKKLLEGEYLTADAIPSDIDESLPGTKNSGSKEKHLTDFFRMKPNNVYNLFDLISKHSEGDVRFIVAEEEEKTYQWNGRDAALSAFFAYLKDKHGLMVFNDDKERTTLGKSAAKFFNFSGKEPSSDTFKKSKLNTEKYFKSFDRLFDQIKGKAQSYFKIEEWKELRGKK
jgi:hypothetical protein